jgi:polyisoprenyl-phosphate glycosyltransferase
MNQSELPTISVVVPVYNEQECLHELHKRVADSLEALGESFEFVFVDDGSRDRSLEILRELSSIDSRVRFLSFSRNFGHQAAIYAGLTYSQGQAIISMDADLQHPVELLPTMIRYWREGHDVVYTIKDETSSLSPLRRIMMFLAYRVIRILSGLDIEFGQSDFRLLDAKVVDALLQMPEKRKFLRGLISWAGYSQKAIRYPIAPRFAGQTKYTYSKLFRLAFDGIFSFSIVPLRAVLASGFLGTLVCFLYGVYVLLILISNHASSFSTALPSGWLSLMVAVLFLGSVELISLGVIGEYVGRIYEETRDRPLYLLKETSSSHVKNHAEIFLSERIRW